MEGNAVNKIKFGKKALIGRNNWGNLPIPFPVTVYLWLIWEIFKVVLYEKIIRMESIKHVWIFFI